MKHINNCLHLKIREVTFLIVVNWTFQCCSLQLETILLVSGKFLMPDLPDFTNYFLT